jgi:PleD family two-component response regulator
MTTNKVARLGGDKFACPLPETKQVGAKKAFSEVREVLSNRMDSHDWAGEL